MKITMKKMTVILIVVKRIRRKCQIGSLPHPNQQPNLKVRKYVLQLEDKRKSINQK